MEMELSNGSKRLNWVAIHVWVCQCVNSTLNNEQITASIFMCGGMSINV
jgi:hypothetical protein